MKIVNFMGASALALFLSSVAAGASTVYSGITFPDGDVSFADKVIASSLGDGVTSPHDNPQAVLGAPDYVVGSDNGYFSLGLPGTSPDNLPNDQFGFVTVQFTDNSLTTSGNSDADLFIFEIGGAIEQYSVEISKDNIFWILVATITGQPSTIDIDGVAGVNAGDKFSYVRVSDVAGGATSGFPFAGPDIDAIGAISSSTPVDPSPVPLPAGGLLLLTAIAGLSVARRRKS
jgi:hypothetical protein